MGPNGFYGWDEVETGYGGTDGGGTSYYQALDVEDRAPAPGKLFMVSECTNYYDGRNWTAFFRSYREAAAYYRQIDEQAGARGLYPSLGIMSKGISEITEKEAEDIREDRRRADAAEAAFLAEEEERYWQWKDEQEALAEEAESDDDDGWYNPADYAECEEEEEYWYRKDLVEDYYDEALAEFEEDGLPWAEEISE
jgi:hypothetical protein